jgi:Ca-activated chloride channel family protein
MTFSDDPRLTAYAVDEADEETKAAVQASADLQDEADEIRDAARLLTEALGAEPTPALLPEQRAAIEREAVRGRRWHLGAWAAGLAAALTLAVGAGLYQPLRAPNEMPKAKSQWIADLPAGTVPAPAPPPSLSAEELARSRTSGHTGPADTAPAAMASSSSGANDYELSEVVPAAKWSQRQEGVPAGVEGGVPGGVAGGVVGGVVVGVNRYRGPTRLYSRADDIRQPSAPANREGYAYRADNDFLAVDQNPLSTFSVDVDTASYANVRRFLNAGQRPPVDAVRIEEMINYFPSDDAPPTGDDRFSAHIEVAAAPWNAAHRLVRIGLKTRALEARPDSNLVFLVDVSGSMESENKLPLVKQALRLLVENLTEHDRVTMVVYAGSAGEVLPPTRGDRHAEILSAIDHLEAGGSTNGGEGIELAYRRAAQQFIRGGVNRVILATDGDFNVGVTDEGSLVRLIEEKAKTGVFLSVFGFGMGNYQDAQLEILADKGNGNYGYIDTLNEARKTLVEQLNATLVTVAKDVKIQVEFNPSVVQSYRLIGYENRLLRPEDFKDDKKDAGEVGAGHAVTALYELVPAGSGEAKRDVDPLVYQSRSGPTEAAPSGELLRLKLRYKDPEGQQSQPKEWPVADRETALAETSGDFRFAAAVAELGMILRDSPHKGSATIDSALQLAEGGRGKDPHGYRAEFIGLVHKAKAVLARPPKAD